MFKSKSINSKKEQELVPFYWETSIANTKYFVCYYWGVDSLKSHIYIHNIYYLENGIGKSIQNPILLASIFQEFSKEISSSFNIIDGFSFNKGNFEGRIDFLHALGFTPEIVSVHNHHDVYDIVYSP